MGTRVSLNHQTNYKYDKRITLGPQIVRLRPASHCRTPISSYSLKVKPAKYFINWQQDPLGNRLARLVFPEPTNEFSVEVDLIAELSSVNPFDFFLRTIRRTVPVQIPGRSGARSRTVSEDHARRPASWQPAHQHFEKVARDRWFSRRSESHHLRRSHLRDSLGTRHPDSRRNAGKRQRFVPRFRLAAGASAAASRSRCAFCLRLSHSTRHRKR